MRTLKKQELYDVIGHVLSVETGSMGRGSKEYLKILEAFARRLGVSSAGGKQELMRVMLESVGQTWDKQCFSTGDTVTAIAFSRLLEGLLTHPEYGERNQDRFIQWRRVREFVTPPDGQQSPTQIRVTRLEYRRDGEVVAYALNKAEGMCRGCRQPAPFDQKSDGQPFLEVHHVVPLSEGGSDTVDNAIAVCPNCHRRAHYSNDHLTFREWLMQAVRERDQQ